MKKREKTDTDNIKRLLDEGNLTKFCEQVELLTDIWFEDKKHTNVTAYLENYFLSGGVFGSLENRVLVQKSKKGGKLPYALSRIWQSREKLKEQYPNLEKKRYLLCYYQFHRWFSLIFGGKLKSSVKELSLNSNMSKENTNEIENMLTKLGLK